MTRDELLTNYQSFLNETIADNPLPDSGGALPGVIARLGSLGSILDPVNKLLTEKLNELLPQVDESERDDIINIVADITRKAIVSHYYNS
jgi:hypothetical protein